MRSPNRSFALVGLVALAQMNFAAESLPGLPASFDITAIDQFIASQVKQASRVGLSVAIVKDGRLVLARGYGQRSKDNGRTVETNTLFAIGSVTKQFTCACILLLAEDGKLSVQDPVAKYYPELTRARDITLLDLMNHVSGYPDYYPLDFVDRRMQKPLTEDELLRQYAGGRLDFEPGSKWSYSNTGYVLLGRVVEKVSGEPFGAFLRRRILAPHGLEHTQYEPAQNDARLARGYTTFALSEPEVVAPEADGWIAAAGAVYSTPSDLARWNLALMDGKVLKPASYELMTRRRTLTDGRQTEYGCGLSVKTQEGRQVLSHNGAVSGFAAWSAFVPSTRSSLVMLCNVDGGLGTLPGQLFSLLLKEAANIPKVSASPAAETVKTVFAELQQGRVDRHRFSEEFNHFLTGDKAAGAAQRLNKYGAPRSTEVLSTHERGGMEVTTTRLTFGRESLRVLMYRRPDGILEQFFVSPD